MNIRYITFSRMSRVHKPDAPRRMLAHRYGAVNSRAWARTLVQILAYTGLILPLA